MIYHKPEQGKLGVHVHNNNIGMLKIIKTTNTRKIEEN